ncbi:MAG: DUF4838 domain-containing protein [Armatimonadetes bacterium]|nr:DUF4838 domain-containing protein [Armatimonadota bacterium]
MRPPICCLCLAPAVALAPARPAEVPAMHGLILVQDGKARVSIAVVGSATAAREARNELIETVLKATGATLPTAASPVRAALVLAVGEGARTVGISPAELMSQGFRIRCDGHRLVIAARRADGLYYGVCAFLERVLGARWLWPGPGGEVVPRQGTLAVPEMSLAECPDYLWRHFGPGGPLFRGEDRWQAERRLGTSEATQQAVRRWMRRNRMGGLRIEGGNAWGRIIPPEEHAGTHPEYFALVRGERAAGPWDGQHGYQLCTTNPEVIEQVVRYCRGFFDAHPEVDALSISPNDGAGFCECPECAADLSSRGTLSAPTLSDRLFAFAGAVASELRKTHPGKLLLLLARHGYQDPPRRAPIPDNVIVHYCTAEAGFHDPAARRADLRRARALGRNARHLAIREPYISDAWPDLPRLLTRAIADSIRDFRAAGARYCCPQAGNGFAINGWNYYLAARLLWNTRQDPDAILEDFCRAGFGAAAGSVRRYLQSVAQHRADAGSRAATGSRYQQIATLFPPDLLGQWRALLEQASAEAGAVAEKERVAFLQAGLRYAERAMEALRRTAAVEAAGLPVSGTPEAAIARLRAEGRWPAVETLIREAAQAWEARDALLETHRDDVVVSHLWIRMGDGEGGLHPRAFFAAVLPPSSASPDGAMGAGSQGSQKA